MMPQPITNDSPLPWEQHEYPGKPPVDDVRLHARREGVFTVAAGVFAVAAALLPALGLSPALDLTISVPQLGREVPVAVPVGALAFPLTFFCIHLLCELFGRRRAALLVMLGAVLGALAQGVVLAAATAPLSLELGAGLVAFTAVAVLVDLGAYALLRRLTGGRHLWLRHGLASAAALGAAGLAFAGITGSEQVLWAAMPYGAAAIVVAAPLLYLLAGWLGVYLRLPLAHQEARLAGSPLHAGASAELV